MIIALIILYIFIASLVFWGYGTYKVIKADWEPELTEAQFFLALGIGLFWPIMPILPSVKFLGKEFVKIYAFEEWVIKEIMNPKNNVPEAQEPKMEWVTEVTKVEPDGSKHTLDYQVPKGTLRVDQPWD